MWPARLKIRRLCRVYCEVLKVDGARRSAAAAAAARLLCECTTNERECRAAESNECVHFVRCCDDAV